MKTKQVPFRRAAAAFATVALLAGCGASAPSDAGRPRPAASAAEPDQAVKFAECVRTHGVADFPDPNAKGEFVYGVSVSPAVFRKAVDACKDLQPPGSLSAERDPGQQSAALRFAACMRSHGVKDFPDPANGEPLVDTDPDPLVEPRGWHDDPQRRDAEVPQRHGRGGGGPVTRWTRMVAGTAAVVALAAAGGAAGRSGGDPGTRPDGEPAPATTAPVERGPLAAVVSGTGILTYRARRDGSPYAVINQARGVYTRLPASGDEVGCGDVLYRVGERPVLLLCGAIPAYRALRAGDAGRDVRQLNRALRVHGAGDVFTVRTEGALRRLQRRRGAPADGALGLGDAVFLPQAVRIAKVGGEPGAPARPGAPVLSATSDRLHVRVDFDASQQGQVKRGDRARIALPGNATAAGRVVGFGRIAQAPAEQDAGAADATIPTYIRLDDRRRARGLDRAPVGVEIATAGVDDALSVPVTALVGKAGGGFAVEAVRAGARRELVAVDVGLFDSAAGRVQIEGAVREDDRVVVPAP
ncbi:MAG TPA: efflux RND transporter periplasmic adaptor subunit [Solirubrobacteraceae bacterium]